jgi:hypothetical protein
MTQHESQSILARQRILALKEEVMKVKAEIAAADPEAAASLEHARGELFRAWTLLAGPPGEEDEDH